MPDFGTAADPSIEEARARIRRGGLRGRELVEWLGARPPDARERDLERLLDVASEPDGLPPLPPGLIGHVPSGLVAILRSVLEAPIGPNDRFVDVGAGLGKVAMAVNLLAGASCLGIEIQPALAEQASRSAALLGLDGVRFTVADARTARLDGASVVYLYAPFQGAAVDGAMERIRDAARRSALVVCALALDLSRFDWLVERPGEDVFFSIYDSRVPGARPRTRPPAPRLGALAEAMTLGGRSVGAAASGR